MRLMRNFIFNFQALTPRTKFDQHITKKKPFKIKKNKIYK